MVDLKMPPVGQYDADLNLVTPSKSIYFYDPGDDGAPGQWDVWQSTASEPEFTGDWVKLPALTSAVLTARWRLKHG
jgi:hypothetical protein